MPACGHATVYLLLMQAETEALLNAPLTIRATQTCGSNHQAPQQPCSLLIIASAAVLEPAAPLSWDFHREQAELGLAIRPFQWHRNASKR